MQHYIDTIEAKSDVFASQLERTVTETEGDTNATRSKLTKSMLSGPPIPDAQQGRQWRTGNSGVSSVLSRIPDERQGNQQVDADEDTDTTEGNIDDDVDTVQPVAMGTLDCIPQQYRSRIKESQLTTVPQTVVISLINTDDNLSKFGLFLSFHF